MKIQKLNELRKEDENYFQGPFWIISNDMISIFKGEFELLIVKYLCDYDGNDLSNESKNSKTHQNIWKNRVGKDFSDKPFNYYPRGRVSIYNGTAFIHINSKCNLPKIIDKIISEYELSKLDIYIEENDLEQGSHYDYLLK